MNEQTDKRSPCARIVGAIGKQPMPRSELSGTAHARHRPLSIVAGAICAALAILVLAASPSFAAEGYAEKATLGEMCSANPCGAGQLSDPIGVAADSASEASLIPEAGDVYVIDEGDERI